jgi:Ca-activated chloride channel family protein
MDYEASESHEHPSTVRVDLRASQERQLIHPMDSSRYIVFFTQVNHSSIPAESQKRLPLSLALVLDRSGSMQGAKLQTAKQAALSVLDQLTPSDTVSLVVFDDQIDTVQSAAVVTPQLKSRVREALHALQARSSTALHEGWLTGCNSIADSAAKTGTQGLARCFLLTDGIANVGVTDPERIASEAAGIHEHEAISTSTFGIGSDYNELLLGPMAVAGGGQFHHLRSPDEIINTFVGELGGLLSVAALQVHLEIETTQGVELDLISSYWMRSATENPLRRVISIGDLQGGEERPVVVRFTFPEQADQEPQVIRARLTWRADNTECSTDWQEVRFSYASQSACEGEPRDPQVVHWVAQHEADRARREAVAYNNRGDVAGAQQHLQQAATSLNAYAPGSKAVHSEIESLKKLAMPQAMAAPAAAKEVYYSQQLRSRNQADYRQTTPTPMPPEASKQTADQQPSQDQKGRRKIKLPWQSPGKDEKPSR